MVAQDSEFFSFSQNIAEQFLQTAVIIDDRAEFSSQEEIQPQDVNPPSIRRRPSAEETEPDNSDLNTQNDENRSHFLDAKIITDQFAQKGIICSVLKPTNQDELSSIKDTVVKLVSCADIVILDWQLHNDDGEFAQEIILQIASGNDASSKQLRLITIYTGEPDIIQVAEKVQATLHDHGIESQLDKSEPVLTFESIKVIVLAKSATGLAPHLKLYEVDFSELANKVTQEFTRMTAGLISNAVLLALTKVRQNTFKILNNFSRDLDAPFLTHRALQVDPRDAEEHITSLIAEEILAILEEAQVGQETTNLEAIKKWLDSVQFELPTKTTCVSTNVATQLNRHGDISDLTRKIDKITSYFAQSPEVSDFHKDDWQKSIKSEFDDLDIGNSHQINSMQAKVRKWIEMVTDLSIFRDNITLEQIYSLLEHGIDNWQNSVSSIKKREQKAPFTKLFSVTLPKSNSDEQFAMVTSTRSYYGDEARKLSLGTIVKRDVDGDSQYLLCVQPKCDTYRLEKPRVFLFLPFVPFSNQKYFNIVVFDDNAYLRLVLEKKPYQLIFHEFEPDKELQIVITGDGEYTDTDGKKHQWIAELRFEHAQRISNRLATELSRVGVNESQWLRRWAKE